MPKTDDKKQPGAPAGDEAQAKVSDMKHFWSAQCSRCHKVGNMQGQIDPKDGIVCSDCATQVGQVKDAPVVVADPGTRE